MRTETIKLYGADGMLKRWISYSQARKLERGDLAVLACEHCGRSNEKSRCLGKREAHYFACLLRDPERRNPQNPSAITADEMKVFAGVPPGKGLDYITDGRWQAVAMKVAMWGMSSIRHVLPAFNNQPNEYIPPDAEELGVKEVGAP